MHKITAKVICNKVERTVGTEQVTLSAVTANSEENKTWAKYTPAAQINLTITNPDAFGAFVPGQEYLVTFEPTY